MYTLCETVIRKSIVIKLKKITRNEKLIKHSKFFSNTNIRVTYLGFYFGTRGQHLPSYAECLKIRSLSSAWSAQE